MNKIISKKDIIKVLEDCVDSFEYVNTTHPNATGWGVRLQRIQELNEVIKTLKTEGPLI